MRQSVDLDWVIDLRPLSYAMPPDGYGGQMSENPSEQEHLGRLTDEEEAAEQSMDEGASAAGEYDPAQGSPGTPHAPATPDEE